MPVLQTPASSSTTMPGAPKKNASDFKLPDISGSNAVVKNLMPAFDAVVGDRKPTFETVASATPTPPSTPVERIIYKDGMTFEEYCDYLEKVEEDYRQWKEDRREEMRWR